MSEAPDAVPGVTRPTITPLDLIRTIVLIASLASLVLWGLSMWDFPWNIVAAVAIPLIVLLVWALFLSPRPVLQLHPFVRAAVELLIYLGVTLAWWSMGQAWVGLGFAIVAIFTGLFSGWRNLK